MFVVNYCDTNVRIFSPGKFLLTKFCYLESFCLFADDALMRHW